MARGTKGVEVEFGQGGLVGEGEAGLGGSPAVAGGRLTRGACC